MRKKIKVVVDRPIGYQDAYGNIYPINYGYVPNVIGGDGEEQDVYILGETKPLKTYEGELLAIIHRTNDNETKWITGNQKFSEQEIKEATNFMEQYFTSYIELIEE